MIIYDVSHILHIGNGSNTMSKFKTTYGLPTGALYHFLRTYVSDLAKGEEIYLCMDSPTKNLYRHIEYPDYKADRLCGDDEIPSPQRMAFNIQYEILKYILDYCSIPYMTHQGFEADDFIYSIVNYHKYEPNISIRATDFDLIDTKLLNPNVRFLQNHTTINEYPVGVIRDKIKKGCRSDKIPKLPNHLHQYVDNINLRKAKGEIKPNIEYVHSFTGLEGDDLQRLVKNIFLAYPHFLNLKYLNFTTPSVLTSINIDRLKLILQALECKSILRNTFKIYHDYIGNEIADLKGVFNLISEGVIYNYGLSKLL